MGTVGQIRGDPLFDIRHILVVNGGIGRNGDAILVVTVDGIHGKIPVHIFHIRQGGGPAVRVGHRNWRIPIRVVKIKIPLQDAPFPVQVILVIVEGRVFRRSRISLCRFFCIIQPVKPNVLQPPVRLVGIKGINKRLCGRHFSPNRGGSEVVTVYAW